MENTSNTEDTSDLKVLGNPDVWQLICKQSSEEEEWAKSTRAMQVGSAVVLRLTSIVGDVVDEQLLRLPECDILEDENGNKYIG